MSVKIICAFNNLELFDDVVNRNENIQNCEIFPYDNRDANISVTKRYNSFIEEYIGTSTSTRATNILKENCWCAFIHQDFGFMEDIEPIMQNLDPNCIYGAIGVKVFKGLFFGKKGIDRTLGFKTDLSITVGQILQGSDVRHLEEYGNKIPFPVTADAVDCCCIIIHSSLIRKYNLLFDENLSFHMYAEELCYRAKKEFKINTKVVPIKCFHLGKGNLDDDYRNSVQYLKEKFQINRIPSNCPN